jgi:hypothetical protein
MGESEEELVSVALIREDLRTLLVAAEISGENREGVMLGRRASGKSCGELSGGT